MILKSSSSHNYSLDVSKPFQNNLQPTRKLQAFECNQDFTQDRKWFHKSTETCSEERTNMRVKKGTSFERLPLAK